MWGAYNPLSESKKLVRTEHVKCNNTSKVLAVKWAVKSGILPKYTKWYTSNWEHRKVIEKDGKKLFWDWEHPMRMDCIAHRPGLRLEDTSKKMIY